MYDHRPKQALAVLNSPLADKGPKAVLYEPSNLVCSGVIDQPAIPPRQLAPERQATQLSSDPFFSFSMGKDNGPMISAHSIDVARSGLFSGRAWLRRGR
jgi:hypothetical protein